MSTTTRARLTMRTSSSRGSRSTSRSEYNLFDINSRLYMVFCFIPAVQAKRTFSSSWRAKFGGRLSSSSRCTTANSDLYDGYSQHWTHSYDHEPSEELMRSSARQRKCRDASRDRVGRDINAAVHSRDTPPTLGCHMYLLSAAQTPL